MPPLDDAQALREMVDNARKALAAASSRTRSDLEGDWLGTYAIVLALQIVGEAARRVSEDLRSGHPEVPWSRIVGFRNRVVHGYDRWNLDRVWEIVQEDVPALIRDLERILQSLEG